MMTTKIFSNHCILSVHEVTKKDRQEVLLQDTILQVLLSFYEKYECI